MKGKKSMMIIKMMIVTLLLLLVLLGLWCGISGNKIREYKDEAGNILPGSVSSKEIVEINGVPNGFFINGKDASNPVLLLVSSGPGTDDYFLTERFGDMHIDDIFTLVYWDYRGMGLVYDPVIQPETITEEVLLRDTKAVTEYLMDRFDQDKIYIMGFSGGTRIAIKAAHMYPEYYHAYIGMAQAVTDSSERDQLMYDFMKSVFEQRGQKGNLKKLDSTVHYENDGIHCNDWAGFVYLLHSAGGGTIHNESELFGIDIPIFMSRCYTITEKINYICGLKMYRETAFEKESQGYDLRESLTEFEIPIFMVSGEYDYNCPQPLVKDYLEKLNAPDKEFYLVKNAAHSPLWENTEDSFDIFKEILERTYYER